MHTFILLSAFAFVFLPFASHILLLKIVFSRRFFFPLLALCFSHTESIFIIATFRCDSYSQKHTCIFILYILQKWSRWRWQWYQRLNAAAATAAIHFVVRAGYKHTNLSRLIESFWFCFACAFFFYIHIMLFNTRNMRLLLLFYIFSASSSSLPHVCMCVCVHARALMMFLFHLFTFCLFSLRLFSLCMNVCFFVLFCFVSALFILFLFLFFSLLLVLSIYSITLYFSLCFSISPPSCLDVYKNFNPLKSLIYFYLRSFADLNHAYYCPYSLSLHSIYAEKCFATCVCISISLFSDSKTKKLSMAQRTIDFVEFNAEVVNFVVHCTDFPIQTTFNLILIQGIDLVYAFFRCIRCYSSIYPRIVIWSVFYSIWVDCFQ